jgi:outer membrane protein TolC
MFRSPASLLGAMLLAGCAAVPKLGEAPKLAPVERFASQESFKAPAAEWPADAWWTAYGDPQLDALMQEALAGSPDLQEAAARVRAADAQARSARAATLPALSASAQAAEVKQSYNNGFPAQFVPKGYNDTGRATLDLSFDLDIWGRNRAALDEQLAIARNRLAALAGAGPDRGLALQPPAASPKREFGLPPNLAADLLGRRPDLQAARLRAEAAAKRIRVARAGFYPDLNLTAFIGAQSLGLHNLTKSGSDIGQGALALSLPIFQGGRLEGAYRGARAEYDAAVAAYDRTLIAALQETADAAASSRALEQRLAAARESLAAGEGAYRVARLRYEGGLSTYLDLLTAEDQLIAQRRAVAQLEARALSLDANLVRALGGGFRA